MKLYSCLGTTQSRLAGRGIVVLIITSYFLIATFLGFMKSKQRYCSCCVSSVLILVGACALWLIYIIDLVPALGHSLLLLHFFHILISVTSCFFRVIPHRWSQPEAYRLYLELLSRYAFKFDLVEPDASKQR